MSFFAPGTELWGGQGRNEDAEFGTRRLASPALGSWHPALMLIHRRRSCSGADEKKSNVNHIFMRHAYACSRSMRVTWAILFQSHYAWFFVQLVLYHLRLKGIHVAQLEDLGISGHDSSTSWMRLINVGSTSQETRFEDSALIGSLISNDPWVVQRWLWIMAPGAPRHPGGLRVVDHFPWETNQPYDPHSAPQSSNMCWL